eukprot:875428-Pelagomonas_calceolata.AAC.1
MLRKGAWSWAHGTPLMHTRECTASRAQIAEGAVALKTCGSHCPKDDTQQNPFLPKEHKISQQ